MFFGIFKITIHNCRLVRYLRVLHYLEKDFCMTLELSDPQIALDEVKYRILPLTCVVLRLHKAIENELKSNLSTH